jgi:multidrug efflux system outer membrane protein
MTGKKIIILLTALSLTACTMIPGYRRPTSPIPQNWPTGAAYQQTKRDDSAPTLAGLSWRKIFTDERLQKVIELALENNRDLRLAILNVERTRALYGIQRAEQLPAVYAVGLGSNQHVPADLSFTGKETTVEQYSVSLGLSSWEIDFFGRIRSLKDRALEEYLATDQARRSAQTVLVSAVAIAYLTLAADRENLKLAASTLETQETAYRLIQKRHEVGLISALDLRRAQSQVETARRDIAVFTQLVAQDENALTLLVGSPPPQSFLPLELYSVSPPQEISPGLSSEVLLNRPDVLAAEHRLKATNANIGAARAAFFPRISLTTTIGTASADLSGLFQSGSMTWSFIPQIALPVFDARTWSAYEVTKVDREIAVTQYEKTIQTAFREVADALAVKGTVEQQIASQQSLVYAVGETYRLSHARYDKGLDSYLGVLDAQRSLYVAQQGLIVLRLAGLINRVTLFKVLDWGEP